MGRHTRKPSYLSNLMLTHIILLLVCFETHVSLQPFLTCHRQEHRSEIAATQHGPSTRTFLLLNSFTIGTKRVRHLHAGPVEEENKRGTLSIQSSISWSWGFDAKLSNPSTRNESDDAGGRKTKTRHPKELSSNCSCPRQVRFDQADFRHVHTASCAVHWDEIVLLNQRFSDETGPVQIKRQTNRGKRCQKLQATAWNVDADVNYKGQAKRNSLRQPNLEVNLRSVRPNCHRANEQRSVQDHLFMSDYQRKDSDKSESGYIVPRLLVSLATIPLLLRELLRMQNMEDIGSAKKHRRSPHLLPGPRAPNERCNKRQQKKVFYDSSPNKLGRPNRSCSVIQDVLRSTALDPHHVVTSSPRPPREWWVFPATGFLPLQNSDGAQYLDHVGYRLASLAALPSSFDVSRIRLAEAGFHYDLRSSSVMCHGCGASLSREALVAEDRSALNWHWSQSPNCPVLVSMLDDFTQRPPGSAPDQQQQAGQQEGAAGPRWNVAGTELSNGHDLLCTDDDRTDSVPNGRGQPSPSSRLPAGRPGDSAPSSTARNQPGPASSTSSQPSTRAASPVARREDPYQLDINWAVYPQFSTTQSRLNTFRNWTLSGTFSPDMLVNLGFYYAGYADCIRCFYCGVGLKSWDANDDPLKEHARWRPNCGFLLRIKGSLDDIHRRIDNQSGASQGESAVPELVQQLMTMGFEPSAIERARLQVRHAGEPEDIDHLLAVLLP